MLVKPGSCQEGHLTDHVLPHLLCKSYDSCIGLMTSLSKTERFEKNRSHDEDEDGDGIERSAWDDITGARLDPKEVEKARKEEIGYVKKHSSPLFHSLLML